MIGLGTIINTALILAGGALGLIFKRFVKDSMGDAIMTACGASIIMMAIGGVMEKMLTVGEGGLGTQGTVMMIISLAVGTAIGEIINIDGRIERFGSWLKEKSGSSGDKMFLSAFVNASCTVCIGAMAVVGSVMDAIYQDYSILLAKGVLDAIIICIMAASQGKGAVFSAIPVFLFQGIITLISAFAGNLMSEAALGNLSYVGSVMIFCVGLNLIRSRKIRVANMLPGLVICALWP